MNKEQLNDSLKNSDKNFNENFTHEKEQIIIDGVKVLKEKINMCFILLLNKLETPETIEQTIYEHLDTFVKEWSTQLARKTQECEELKSQIDADYEDYSQELKTLRNIIENKEKRNARLFVISNNYRKALEEIEDIAVKNNITEFDFGGCADLLKIIVNLAKDYGDILDIINKAKGEGNE